MFDLGFIDADKPSYPAYYEEILTRLRPGGVVLVDNVLWGGAVVDPSADDDNVEAIRAFNDMVAADDRVESTILTIGDGLTIALEALTAVPSTGRAGLRRAGPRRRGCGCLRAAPRGA